MSTSSIVVPGSPMEEHRRMMKEEKKKRKKKKKSRVELTQIAPLRDEESEELLAEEASNSSNSSSGVGHAQTRGEEGKTTTGGKRNMKGMLRSHKTSLKLLARTVVAVEDMHQRVSMFRNIPDGLKFQIVHDDTQVFRQVTSIPEDTGPEDFSFVYMGRLGAPCWVDGLGPCLMKYKGGGVGLFPTIDWYVVQKILPFREYNQKLAPLLIVEADRVTETDEELVSFTFSKDRIKVHKVVSTYQTIVAMPVLEGDISDAALFRFYQAWANTRYVLHVDPFQHHNDGINSKRSRSCCAFGRKGALMLEDEFPVLKYPSDFAFGDNQSPD